MMVGRTAFALGLSGLLPPLGMIALMVAGERDTGWLMLAYALLILSFLGCIWWGMAMRRPAGAQAVTAAAAVVPSLAAFAISAATAVTGRIDCGLVATGIGLLLTLPFDRHLAASGDAPANWMRLRIPLSAGLGTLAIITAILLQTR